MKLRSISKFRSHISTRLSPGVDSQGEVNLREDTLCFMQFYSRFHFNTKLMAFHSVQRSSSSYSNRVGFKTKFILELADVSNEFLFGGSQKSAFHCMNGITVNIIPASFKMTNC